MSMQFAHGRNACIVDSGIELPVGFDNLFNKFFDTGLG